MFNIYKKSMLILQSRSQLRTCLPFGLMEFATGLVQKYPKYPYRASNIVKLFLLSHALSRRASLRLHYLFQCLGLAIRLPMLLARTFLNDGEGVIYPIHAEIDLNALLLTVPTGVASMLYMIMFLITWGIFVVV